MNRLQNRRRGVALVGLLALIVILMIVVVGCGSCGRCDAAGWILGSAVVGMGFLLKDNQLVVTKALPAGASAVTSDAIDLGHGSSGDFLADVEVLISAPALAVGQLADTTTIIYDLIMGDSSDLTSSPTTIIAAAITQTGAGGAGAAAATYQCRLPVDVKRYVGIKATKTGAASAAAASLTVQLVG